MSVWDDPELRNSGDFIKFDKVGDKVSGTVVAVQRHKFDDGNVVPKLLLVTDDGEEKTLTAGQVRLKAELAEQRPEAGDHIVIELTQEEKRSGGKTLKHFTVEVKRGDGTVPTATKKAEDAPAGAPDPALLAALSGLTAEQKAQLGLPV